MDTFKKYVDGWTNLIGTSVAGLLLTAATVVFFYSVVRFILKRSSGDTKGLEDAKSNIGWAILGLTVMFSVWGIVSFFQATFEISGKTEIVAPSVKVNSSNTTNTNQNSTNNALPLPAGLSDGSICSSGSQCKSGVCSSSNRCKQSGI